MLRHVLQHVILYLVGGALLALLQDHARHYLLAVRLVGNADDLNVRNLRVGVDEVLYLLRVDVLASADYHILDTARDLEIPVRVAPRQIARVEPSVRVDGERGRVRHLVISLHYVVTAGDELSVDAVWKIGSRLRVDDLALDAEDRRAHRVDARLERVGRLRHRRRGGRLRLAVGDADLVHVHLLDDLLHHLDRAGRARHDPGAHMGEIGRLEELVVHHRDKHRRNAVERRDLLFVYALEPLARRERRDRRHRRAVGHRRRHCEYHAEAVEHRDLDHHPVGGRQIHTVADRLAVVDDIVVREHDALRKAGRPGRVLHIADVVLVYHRRAAIDRLDRSPLRHRRRLVPRETSRYTRLARYYVSEEREPFAVERVVRILPLQLGTELPDYRNVVRILVAVDHHERVRVRLAEQIFRLVDLVRCVHRHEDGADLDRRPERDIPLRHVRRPNRDVVALSYAEGDQSAREGVDVVAELGVRARVIERRVAEGVLIRELLADAVKHLRESQVDELFLLPDIFAVAPARLTEPPRPVALVDIRAHEVREVREDDRGVGQIRLVLFQPFERDVPLVVHRAQRAHELVYRQVALSHHPVFDAAVLHDGVLNVRVLDERAEILYRRLRALPGEAIRVVHIPERADRVAPYRGEHGGEPVGMRIDAVRLDKQRNARLFGDRRELLHRFDDEGVVKIGPDLRRSVAEHPDIPAPDRRGDLYVSLQLGDRLLAPLREPESASRGQTADLEAHPVKRLARFGEVFVAERAGGRRKRRPAEASHLDPGKPEILRHRPDLVPREIGTAER